MTDLLASNMEESDMEINQSNQSMTFEGPATNLSQSWPHTHFIPGTSGQPQNKKQRKCDQNHHLLNKKLKEALNLVTVTMNELKDLQEKMKSNENNLNCSHLSVEIEKPKFSTPEYGHPLNFLENLTTYLDKLPVANRTNDTVIDCLYGDAKNWAALYKPRWKNFELFKKDFIHQYWGPAEQNLLRKEIVGGRWNRQHETMFRHFMCLISQAKWLPNEIPQNELIYDLMCHYPKVVQIAWSVNNKNSLLGATQFLRKMDDVELRFGGKKKKKQTQKKQKKYIIQSKREYRWTATNTECVEEDSSVVSFNPVECIDLCNDS